MFAQQTVAEITLLTFPVGTFVLLLLNCITNISPITGIWLILYLTTILILSIWITSVAIQKLLGLNKPLKYDLSIYCNKYPILKVFSPILPKISIAPAKANITPSKNDYDTAELSIISTVIERKLVSSWYKNFVSEEIGFPFACKQLLDGMINKGFQISNNIDTVSLSTDIMAVTLKHYKEYYRAQKRQERASKGNLEDYYKAQHPTFSTNAIRNKKYTTTQHCYLVIRVILKELLPWELWETPHSDLLVSILAKKLDEFLKKNLCDPVWIHRMIQNAIRSNETTKTDSETAKDMTPAETETKIENNVTQSTINKPSQVPSNEIVTNTTDDVKAKDISGLPKTTVPEASIQSALSHLISKSTAPILQRAELDVPVIKNGHSVLSNSSAGTSIPILKTSDPVDILNSPRHKKPRKNGDHVKIHDRIMEGSVRTWNSDVDLECVSLGQDLLANFDGEMTLESRLGRLWEADNLEASDGWSPNPPVSSTETKSPQTLWFGEEDTIEPEAQEGSPIQQTNVRTPSIEQPLSNFSLSSIHNIKDLQNISKTTVSHAKNKIGDLQDEAAGVMEGILDLGIAGLRKGLRLTGLHETQQEMKNLLAREKGGSSDENKPGSGRVTPCDAAVTRPELPTKKTPSGKAPTVRDEIPKKVEHAAPTCSLVKQARVSSQDSVASISEPPVKPTSVKPPPAPQPIPIAELVADSPELEYEDPADFASTIAKLRCLLQQKGSDGTNSEDSTTSLDKTSPAPGTSPGLTELVNMPLETIKEAKGKPDNFFSLTKPIDHATLADEYDLPVHRSHIPGPTTTHNNMQRLDRLFQRTVTGVFNSIKTVVGAEGGNETINESGLDGDQPISVPLHKNTLLSDNWLFVESDADMSSAVGRLVGERRSFCLVEPGQDTLETLASPPNLSVVPPPIDDDLEDLVNGCALWAGLLELAAAVLGGRHVLLHCITVLLADKAEVVLEQQLNVFTNWCRIEIFNVFERMQQKTTKENKTSVFDEQESNLNMDLTVDLLYQRVPTNIISILGEQKLRSALKDLVNSVNNASTNQDLAFQLLDVLAVHFTRASALRDAQRTMTPPPSA